MKRELPNFQNRALLAPMAGFTDSAFRRICREQGAAATVSEMVSAKALRLGDKKTPLLMQFSEQERPFGIQLFGTDPDDIAFAAQFAEARFAPDFIDLNMGCPAPKITGGGAGSRLMTTPQLAARLVAAAVSACSLPVTVKIRAGYDSVNAPLLAPLLEQAGASLLVVHGRTRDQMYRPPVDLLPIRDVKRAVSIPVIGNGDIASAADALRMREITGCDGVMIGRGALGNPFLFAEVNAALAGLPLPALPSAEQRLALLLRQGQLAAEEKGERHAMREMRKHAAHYMHGFHGAAALRVQAGRLETLDNLKALCSAALAAVRDADGEPER